MKVLILLTVSIISLNVFSSELGEDQKGECPFLNQSSKREAKAVLVEDADVSKEATKVISK